MIRRLAIPAEAYEYLVVQRGALDDMKDEPRLWLEKYVEVIGDEFLAIAPFLPALCDSILDVGSGMGGINAFLNDHYGGGVHITLLDGVDDPPQVTAHSKTFNHMAVAYVFLNLNGVEFVHTIDANDAYRRVERKFDLIVSFKSWCFHYEPARYMDLVLQGCHADTELIIDVRRDKPHWLGELASKFSVKRRIASGPKADTYLFCLK